MSYILDSITQNKPVLIAILAAIVILLPVIISIAGNRRSKSLLVRDNGRIWKDRKHTFMGFPWSFTVYSMDTGRIFIKTGFFATTENEVRLYRVLDVQLKRSLWQRLLGLGSIAVMSSDKSMNNFIITNITHPEEVKELLSVNVDTARRENKVSGREIMSFADDDDTDGEQENA